MTAAHIFSSASPGQARELLLAATPPNASYSQQRLFSVEHVDRALRIGARRPEWVWAAQDESGEVLGVVAGWGASHRSTPFILDFLDLPAQPEVAVALLDRAVADCGEPGRATIEIIYFLSSETELEDPVLRNLVDVLSASGFRMLVRRKRYRLEVLAGGITIPRTELRFDQLAGPHDPRLAAVLAEILVGSLDAHDVDALGRADLHTVARETAAEYLELDPVDSIFLAYDPGDALVGLVIGGLRGTRDNGVASFIGVSHRHRGNGYAAQLLGWITKRMVGAGATQILAETDDENFPMAAAFAAVGYPQAESRIDFVRYLL